MRFTPLIWDCQCENNESKVKLPPLFGPVRVPPGLLSPAMVKLRDKLLSETDDEEEKQLIPGTQLRLSACIVCSGSPSRAALDLGSGYLGIVHLVTCSTTLLVAECMTV